MRNVLLLGASGSIGKQTLDILKKYKNSLVLRSFSVGKHSDFVDEMLKDFPEIESIFLLDEKAAKIYSQIYSRIKFFTPAEGLIQFIRSAKYDVAVNALSGFIGLEPSIEILKAGKTLCLANKESIVIGGNLLKDAMKVGGGELIPIDSEHVAITKCLNKCNREDVEYICLTASGGSLRDYPLDKIENVTKLDVLKHPTWNMGEKITVDSATMINKAYEIVEAAFLFDTPMDEINVIINDESLAHSFIKLKDGSYIVDYGKPDMHNAIEYALLKNENSFPVTHVKDLSELTDCHFRDIEKARYPLYFYAKNELINSQSKRVALNASDEVAVASFLKERIKFSNIYDIIKKACALVENKDNLTLEEIKSIDSYIRKETSKHVGDFDN